MGPQLKPFLVRKGASPVDVERMHPAWVKSVLPQVILWSVNRGQGYDASRTLGPGVVRRALRGRPHVVNGD